MRRRPHPRAGVQVAGHPPAVDAGGQLGPAADRGQLPRAERHAPADSAHDAVQRDARGHQRHQVSAAAAGDAQCVGGGAGLHVDERAAPRRALRHAGRAAAARVHHVGGAAGGEPLRARHGAAAGDAEARGGDGDDDERHDQGGHGRSRAAVHAHRDQVHGPAAARARAPAGGAGLPRAVGPSGLLHPHGRRDRADGRLPLRAPRLRGHPRP